MNNRPKIHFHSDCDFFAGCENMLANLFTDIRLQATFDVSFSFRDSARYRSGFISRVKTPPTYQCPNVLSGNASILLAKGASGPFSILIKVLWRLDLFKHLVFARNVVTLWRAWRGKGIDILHINNGGYPGANSCCAAVLAGSLCGIKNIIMVVNNIAAPGPTWKRPLDKIVDYFMARKVTRFITGSHSAGSALISRLGLSKTKVLNFHNGITGRQPDETPEETRRRLGVSGHRFLFGTVAILESRKGHSVLIHALTKLRNMLPLEEMPYTLIEGTGPEEANLRQLVKNLQLDDCVQFIGQERNVFNFLQAIDLFILPSINYEDFPNVILEAMSLGKPVLASRLSGIPEQVDEGVTGWLVEPGDSDQLAQMMLAAVKQRCLEVVGRAARSRFANSFTSEIAVTRYLDLYADILT